MSKQEAERDGRAVDLDHHSSLAIMQQQVESARHTMGTFTKGHLPRLAERQAAPSPQDDGACELAG